MNHIFISYSRKDMDGAQKIVEALSRENLDTWIDWNSIPKGEDWEQEIYRGIEQAEAFLFLISPDSIRSEMCNREILHAIKNKKRILPILLRTADMIEFLRPEAAAEIQRLNWVWCRDGLDDFPSAIHTMLRTIRTDYEWVRFHTMLQVKALAWDQTRRDGSRLLRGRELKGAEDQVRKIRADIEPALTDTQKRYLFESRRAVRRRQTIPVIALLGLALAVFIGGRFYYLLLPIPTACPAVSQVQLKITDSDLPRDVQERLFAPFEGNPIRTQRNECGGGLEGITEVEARSVQGTEEIELRIRMPSTPAYPMDFLPEIREFGPEKVNESKAAKLIESSLSYAVGEYQAAIDSLDSLDGLTVSIIKAQANLFLDKPEESQAAYNAALKHPQLEEETRGRLLSGLALTWWRPETYYQLSLQGKKQDCLKAGGYYATRNNWLDATPLGKNLRIVFAMFCVNSQDANDPAYAPYAGWREETPVWENNPMAPDAELANAIGHFILAFRIGQDPAASPGDDTAELIDAQYLQVARALLSEYAGADNRCAEAGQWRDAYRSRVNGELEKQKLQRLLQTQPLFCR
jgi:hypothetical protein